LPLTQFLRRVAPTRVSPVKLRREDFRKMASYQDSGNRHFRNKDKPASPEMLVVLVPNFVVNRWLRPARFLTRIYYCRSSSKWPRSSFLNFVKTHGLFTTVWRIWTVQMFDAEVQIFRCSAFDNCSTNVQGEDCTFHDLFIDVLHYSSWSQFNTYDGNRQHYNEAIDSLYYLCSNIEPGQTITFRNRPFSSSHSVLIWMITKNSKTFSYNVTQWKFGRVAQRKNVGLWPVNFPCPAFDL